jgi:hypothetical protein
MESNSGKMLVDPDSYAAEMERRFQETAGTSKWYGVYQARKAAFEARKQAAVSQAAAPLRPISTSPPRPIAAPARRSTYVVENSHAESEAARTPKAMSPSWPEELARSARKAALVAKRKAAEKKAAEKKAAEQKGSEKAASAKKVAEKKDTGSPKGVSASSPEVVIDSDSDGAEVMFSAWQPRKKAIKEEPTEGSSSVGNAPPINQAPTTAAKLAKLPAKATLPSAASAARHPSTAKNTSRHHSSTGVKNEDAEKPATQAKRPADPGQDDRRPSAAKKARESSVASSSESPGLPTRRAGAAREPPLWYKQLPKPKGDRGRDESGAETAIGRLKASIRAVRASPSALAKESRDIVERLHALIFLPVDAKLLRRTRILDNNDGLPQLFDSAFTNGIEWPWYLKADAEELYNKWYTGEFETDLYRGITRGLPTKKGKGKGKADASAADRLAEGHQRFKLMDPKQHGNGLLLNGAWFPSQLAALRDGGHGSSQGGITGNPTSGAYSVIMAGGEDPSGKPYPNEDGGDEVLYCGTDNKDKSLNQPSPDTASLLTNYRTKQPVRLFRSHNLDSPFAPELGFRYDGLYDVVSFEDMDPPENKRRRHRFRLVRRAGQDPIRSEGAAKRPTKQEINEYEKDKKNRGR